MRYEPWLTVIETENVTFAPAHPIGAVEASVSAPGSSTVVATPGGSVMFTAWGDVLTTKFATGHVVADTSEDGAGVVIPAHDVSAMGALDVLVTMIEPEPEAPGPDTIVLGGGPPAAPGGGPGVSEKEPGWPMRVLAAPVCEDDQIA